LLTLRHFHITDAALLKEEEYKNRSINFMNYGIVLLIAHKVTRLHHPGSYFFKQKNG